jgi:hypothetical protein
MSVILEQDTSKILGLTRWGAFTETLKSMSAYDIDINEISGNDEIVVSLIMQKNQSLNEPGSELLYTSRIVTDDSSQRNVYLVDVTQLIPLLRSAQASEMIIEHIYDY